MTAPLYSEGKQYTVTREELELCAKLFPESERPFLLGDVAWVQPIKQQPGISRHWNPEHDDGDSTRLARAAGLTIDREQDITHTPRSSDGVMGHYGFYSDAEERLSVIKAACAVAKARMV